jgi:hypothetical protein
VAVVNPRSAALVAAYGESASQASRQSRPYAGWRFLNKEVDRTYLHTLPGLLGSVSGFSQWCGGIVRMVKRYLLHLLAPCAIL